MLHLNLTYLFFSLSRTINSNRAITAINHLVNSQLKYWFDYLLQSCPPSLNHSPDPSLIHELCRLSLPLRWDHNCNIWKKSRLSKAHRVAMSTVLNRLTCFGTFSTVSPVLRPLIYCFVTFSTVFQIFFLKKCQNV